MTIPVLKLPLSNANHACYKQEFESLLKKGHLEKAHQVALERIWWPDSQKCYQKVMEAYINRILPPSLKNKNLAKLILESSDIDEAVKKANFTQKQLKKIEAATLAPENLNLYRVTVWKFLSKCYEHAGNSAEANRLAQKVDERIHWLNEVTQQENHKEGLTKFFNAWKKASCFLSAIYIFISEMQYPLSSKNIFHLSMLTGAVGTYAVSPDVALRGENLLGMYAAMTAVEMGLGPLPALGLGLTTSLASRFPVVPNVAFKVGAITAKTTLKVGKAAFKVMDKAAVVVDKTANAMGAALDRTAVAFGTAVDYTADAMGKVASKLGSIGLSAISAAGKVIGKLDQLMDRVAGIK